MPGSSIVRNNFQTPIAIKAGYCRCRMFAEITPMQQDEVMTLIRGFKD